MKIVFMVSVLACFFNFFDLSHFDNYLDDSLVPEKGHNCKACYPGLELVERYRTNEAD